MRWANIVNSIEENKTCPFSNFWMFNKKNLTVRLCCEHCWMAFKIYYFKNSHPTSVHCTLDSAFGCIQSLWVVSCEWENDSETIGENGMLRCRGVGNNSETNNRKFCQMTTCSKINTTGRWFKCTELEHSFAYTSHSYWSNEQLHKSINCPTNTKHTAHTHIKQQIHLS